MQSMAVVFALTLSGAAAPESVIDKAQQRVVKLFGAGGIRNLNAYSTGFLVDPRGYVVTVWNHVLDTPELTVVLHDGRRFDARVVNAEPTLDLAVLRLETAGEMFPFFRLQAATSLEPGARVLAFSNMFKVATGDEPVSVVHGVVAARTKLTARRGVFEIPFESELYVVDAITNNAGGEGGIITSLRGAPVAMIGRQLRNSETNTWVNYGVPLTELRETIEQIIAGTFTASAVSASRNREGPQVRPEHLGLVMIPDVVQRTPGYVDEVLPGSVAQQAGVQREDLVVFVNDRLVRSCSEFREALADARPGQRIELIVRREDALRTFQITIPAQSQKGGQ